MRNSVILPHRPSFVKYFFRSLETFFLSPRSRGPLSVGAQLIYQTLAPLSTPNFAFFDFFLGGF